MTTGASCEKMKGTCRVILAAALIIPLFAAGYLYKRNAALEAELHEVCQGIQTADREALLRAGVAVVTGGKPYQYEEALANPKLPYAMQEIEERLESLSSKDETSADLVYVMQAAQSFRKTEERCAVLLRN